MLRKSIANQAARDAIDDFELEHCTIGFHFARRETDRLRTRMSAIINPDLSVVCEPPRFEEIGGLRALTNPLLIIEILYPSTEAFDRGDKFTYYKSIPSFCEYVLVAQHRPHITHYVKQNDGKWSYEELNGVSNSIFLATLNCALSLNDIYREVEFPRDASSSKWFDTCRNQVISSASIKQNFDF
jgi:hypothetical protein